MAALLLAGPRGRRLCLELAPVFPFALSDRAEAADDDRARVVVVERTHRYDEHVVTAVVRELSALGDTVGELVQEHRVLRALADSVAHASDRQPPDAEDLLLEDTRVMEALVPVADAVASTWAAGWWSTPVAREEQHVVAWLDEGAEEGRAPVLEGVAGRLSTWRADGRVEERHAQQHDEDDSHPYGGSWSSLPPPEVVVGTTRSLGALPAVQLALVEDPAHECASVTRVTPAPGCRVYEIGRPEDWVELVRRYPLDVRWSRRHDWWRVTGRTGPWLIPDWSAVGADYDGVHLTALGYLSTAGRALAVGEDHTLLAGFAPDATCWLTDTLSQAGEPETWHRDRHRRPGGWTRQPQSSPPTSSRIL